MAKSITLRAVTSEEETEIRRLARSRTGPIHLVQRARIVAAMLQDPDLSATDAGFSAGFKSSASGAMWVRRFNQEGLRGLFDRHRSGRAPTHRQEVRTALVGLALQRPRSLGHSADQWTLSLLQIAFREHHGVHLSDSTIWTWLDEMGYEWRRQDGWPAQAERRDPGSEASYGEK